MIQTNEEEKKESSKQNGKASLFSCALTNNTIIKYYETQNYSSVNIITWMGVGPRLLKKFLYQEEQQSLD